MTKLVRGVPGLILLALACVFIGKYMSLKHTVPDGDGTGIYLYGLEINDSVRNEHMTDYAYFFMMLSVVAVIAAVSYFVTLFNNKNVNNSSSS